jgi:hypothetical protein
MLLQPCGAHPNPQSERRNDGVKGGPQRRNGESRSECRKTIPLGSDATLVLDRLTPFRGSANADAAIEDAVGAALISSATAFEAVLGPTTIPVEEITSEICLGRSLGPQACLIGLTRAG